MRMTALASPTMLILAPTSTQRIRHSPSSPPYVSSGAAPRQYALLIARRTVPWRAVGDVLRWGISKFEILVPPADYAD